MINGQILKQARLSKGWTQAQVAEAVKERFGVGSQQGYRKLEGEAKASKYLAYYCSVLGIAVSEVDGAISGDIDAAINEELAKLLKRPEHERIEIAQKLLASLSAR